MRKNSTGMAGPWVIALHCMLVGCSPSADPDPRLTVRRAAPEATSVGNDAPTVVVAQLAVAAEEPAPIMEARGAVEARSLRHVVIAIGQNAGHAVDRDVRQAFAAGHPDIVSQTTDLTDRDVIDTLMVARASFGIIGGQLSNRDQHAGLRQTPIGIELFALAVAPESPVRSLTQAQVRQILTGQVSEWRQLGIAGGTIVPVVPADAALAERASRVMIPGDTFTTSATRVGSIRHVADQTLQNPGAIGVVRITDAPLQDGLKLVQIDWTTPSFESACWGTYPYAMACQMVTSGAPSEDALDFLEFAAGEAGRALLGRSLRTH